MKDSTPKATRTRSTRKILLVVDSAGRIVATSGEQDAGGRGPAVTLRPLPGQTLHEVPLPAELEEHLRGPASQLHRALEEYELRAGPAQSLLFRRLSASDEKRRSR